MRKLETVYLLLAIVSGIVLVISFVTIYTAGGAWVPAALPVVIGIVSLQARHKPRQARQKNDAPDNLELSTKKTPE